MSRRPLPILMLSFVLTLAAVAVAIGIVRATSAGGDAFVVTLDPAARAETATGRVILYFIEDSERRHRRRAPVSGPFSNPPQPVAAIAVTDLAPGASVTLDASAASFPVPIDDLDGRMRVQAVLDVDATERSFTHGPGNLCSEPVTVDLRKGVKDEIALSLSARFLPWKPVAKAPNLEWVEVRSEMLSAWYGRDVYHRAGLAFPPGFMEEGADGRRWPTVYEIPGFGARHEGAEIWAATMRTPGIEEIAPMAVYIVLDPESPLGHHGFVDSPNHGPRGTAFVTEFVPYLEGRFRLVRRPEGRIVTGHSSGGWSSLWLQLRHPDVFGACWASGPDPVDFRSFQRSNLYEDENVYVDDTGTDQPSLRMMINEHGAMEAVMTVREECAIERVIDPDGRSGEQWDAWDAMFSPADPARGAPRPMFDRATGRIHPDVVERWRRFDIAALVAGDWPKYGPIVTGRIRLSCGDRDSYYLDGAVMRLKEMVEARVEASGIPSGPGYIRMIPYATHRTVTAEIFQDVNREMREHLEAHGLDYSTTVR